MLLIWQRRLSDLVSNGGRHVDRSRPGWCWPMRRTWKRPSTCPGTATGCSSTPRWAVWSSPPCPGSPTRVHRSPRGRCWPRCPASVIRLGAQLGDKVTAGQPLVWLEAMKMEHTITAPADGVLAELNVEPGQQVDVGAVLARVDNRQGDTHDRHRLHRKRRTAGAAQGGRRDGRQLRPGLLPGEGPRRGAHHRIVGGGRQARLHRGEPARGVRRRRRRHVRAVPGDGGDGGRPAARC